MVSRYCQNVGDFKGAIEFLLIAKRPDEAFQVAKDHDEVEMFATALGSDASEADNLRIATFYESKSNWGMVRYPVRCVNDVVGVRLPEEIILYCGVCSGIWQTHTDTGRQT